MDKLAIIGGNRAIEKPFKENWVRPKEKEKHLVTELIDRDELSGTGYGISKEFEETFGSYIGSQHSLAFSHGTASLMAAYYAIGVGPGDEVITPAVGYICSYSGAMHMGARPIFCDIDPETLLIDPVEIRNKITSRTKAINIIHLNGRVCNLDKIIEISQEYHIPIIEDASHAHGALWDNRKIGNSDHITCFSLQGINPDGKPVCGGEGGIATTNTPFYYYKMLVYCHLHRKKIKKELFGTPFEVFDSEVLGLKWRPHPLAMALALVSLDSLDYRNAKREENYQQTIEYLKEFDCVWAPKSHDKSQMGGYCGGVKLIYDSSLFNDIPVNIFLRCLQAEGVPISGPNLGSLEYRRSFFTHGYDLWGNNRGPLNGPWAGLPEFEKCRAKDFPVAEMLKDKVVTLPCFIDVDSEYYTGLKNAFQKLYRHQKSIKFYTQYLPQIANILQKKG